MSTPSKKHHYVARAQLRHFSIDGARKQVWVFDKSTARAWPSAILDAGSENHFNTIEFEGGRWNFEYLFDEVDTRSASLISDIVSRRSLTWFTDEDHAALLDLFATQTLRTHFARTAPRHLAEQMREMVRAVGYDPDEDPRMAAPSDTALRAGAVRSFLRRDNIALSMIRLVPALLATGEGERFVLSDTL